MGVVDASDRTKTIAITGNTLANTICGGSKNDSIFGAAGNDSILGNADNAKLYGDASNNVFIGGKIIFDDVVSSTKFNINGSSIFSLKRVTD